MWYIALWNIVSWIFTKLPMETLVAKAITWTLKKINKPEDIKKISLTIEHVNQSIGMLASIIQDSEVTANEVNTTATELNALRIGIIEAWSKGESAKVLEAKVEELEATEG